VTALELSFGGGAGLEEDLALVGRALSARLHDHRAAGEQFGRDL
jgi:hypothetical protein